ncbi:major facilitator superfamily domain-containing protein 8 [Xiphophorus hellerii]|uniref:major facilitator superfamily domain-containing protein 8 n=1 Tax=Xiphophorus hellerii TaxID=8084 RepID=UPI0013B437DF|nr:major facilitator superfamily domain-containing protein 8-like [Xiphophorus hellerii]XP_032421333.1 major facilitator superfamily domain-containing protein 8-like [Xiphophorus hellerii]XP_032421334.1 major facilitator superfamily domain-containing protein 8-like [Xiphophorus hellerii]XP_032421335.1 major facilitator superfamily domain-containing protein 8-like [Xiphophorus hellerii]
MENHQKRTLTFLTIGLIFMLSGIEYAVILPTIWRYLQILEAPPYFLGLGLSAFSLSALLTGPLFGVWSDRSKTTKSIILFSNLFEIAGNFMYFIGYSKWLLLCSRLVAGVGAGAGSSIFGFLTRSTLPEERAGIFAAIMACRQAGLLVGPAFNLFLRLCDFKLGPFAVNKYTSPGIFMCLLWTLLQFVVLAGYWDVPPISSQGGVVLLEMKQEEEEEAPLMGSDEEEARTYRAVDSDQSETSFASQRAHETSNPFKNFSVSNEFLREEVVVLLTAQFITLFNQTALETMVTPLTQRYFSFGELGNSLMYGLCGVEVIAGFFFVRWLSSRVADRVVLAAGLVICSTACIWCLVFLCKPRGGFEWQLSTFIVGVFLQLLGLPFVAVSQVSLFSKVTAEKTQGFSQGVRRSVGGLATILGPLWAGGLTNNLYIMLGLMLALLVMITVMTVLSYERLAEPRVVQCAQSADSGG